MSNALQVIIADDHRLVLEGLVALLRSAPDILVVGQATDAPGAVRLAQEHLPDVAILDISMPGNGLHAAREIALTCPPTKVLMLTASDDEDDLRAAFQGGASGYLLKGAPVQELISAIHTVSTGEVYLAAPLASRRSRVLAEPSRAVTPDALTEPEPEVLELVTTESDTTETDPRSSPSESAPQRSRMNILEKLQVGSRIRAALRACAPGLG